MENEAIVLLEEAQWLEDEQLRFPIYQTDGIFLSERALSQIVSDDSNFQTQPSGMSEQEAKK